MFTFPNKRSSQRCFAFWATGFSLFLSHSLTAQNAQNLSDSVDLQQITVTATMATAKTPMTFTNVGKTQLRKNDFGQDVPFLLKSTPSVVETSDAGAGIGYTGLRIRGTDPTRTNITVDGVPLNDSESQLVYWVNMPDFASSTSMIQIQRGVGTSTNGSGAFGATINMVTNPPQADKYLNYSGSFGSFNTQKHAIAAGTGLMRNKFAVDMRLSSIQSDGYVDRASSDLQSLYLSGAYLGKKTSLKLKFFTGKEKTYQSWYGIPESYVNDSKLRTYNPAGTERQPEPYANQTDNYQQTHAHATLNHQFSPFLKANVSLHLTHGQGYYEEYRAAQVVRRYIPTWTGRDTTDLVRRLWLDNLFYGAVYSLTYEKGRLTATTGGAWNRYDGDHFGKIIWDQKGVVVTDGKEREFYRSDAVKTDFNVFEKINYAFSPQLNGFLDLQYRRVGYHTEGFDRRQRDIGRHLTYNFFNPKMGLVYAITEGSSVYGSFAVAHREPNRNDLTDAELANLPQSERLLNTELGWRGQFKRAQFGLNFYHMYYNNQLAITGNINDVGEQIRINVPKSFRAGVELEGAFQVTNGFSVSGNLTLSRNKVLDFTEKIDNWDTGGQEIVNRGTTDLAFSPNVISNLDLTYQILRGHHDLSVSLVGKYVGKQFIDNTSNVNTQLDAFSYADLRFFYKTQFWKFKNVGVKLSINNLFNQNVVNNAWAYRFYSPSYDPRPDDPYARAEGANFYNLTGFFPQAGRNFLLGINVGF